MGISITNFGEYLAGLEEDERPNNVIVVSLTDGLENSSKEYTANTVKTMIEHQRDVYSWDFVFLAANQDAVLTASEYGISRGSSLTFGANSEGMRESMAVMDSYVAGTRSGRGYEISDEDRYKSMG